MSFSDLEKNLQTFSFTNPEWGKKKGDYMLNPMIEKDHPETGKNIFLISIKDNLRKNAIFLVTLNYEKDPDWCFF